MYYDDAFDDAFDDDNLTLEEKLAVAEKEKQNLLNAMKALVGEKQLKAIVKAASPQGGKSQGKRQRAIDKTWREREARTKAEQKQRLRNKISISHKKVKQKSLGWWCSVQGTKA